MALDNTKIHQGTARIFLGVTAPTTGTPPTLLTHTAGVPGTGTEVGHTEGDAMWSYLLDKDEITSEQVLAPIDVAAKAEAIKLEFVCQEMTYNTLISAFDNVGTVTDGAKNLFYGGGGTAVLSPKTQCVVLTSIQRNAPTKFIVTVLYKVYTAEGVKFNFGRTKKTTYKMTLIGLADTARNDGDRLFQHFFEK